MHNIGLVKGAKAMDIITKIIFWLDMRKSNNDIYYFIAKTILLHRADIPQMGIEELARLCYTSPATISRFARKLSYKNFSEFKQVFQQHEAYTKNEVVFSEDEITEIKNNPQTIIDKTYPPSIHALKETYEILDVELIGQVTQTLARSEHIAIFGSIFSHLVARDAQYKFLRLGKFTTAFSDFNNQLADARDLSHHDVAIFFSVSGNSTTLQNIADTVKLQDVPTIVITNKVQSPLASVADLVIRLGGNESQFTQSSMSGRIAAMSIVDLLYTSLAFYHESANSPQ
jgi:DNA-binding MurR/RpiR family transcriptional regulator